MSAHPPDRIFQVSRFIQTLELADQALWVAHPFLATRQVLAPALAQCLRVLEKNPSTAEQFAERIGSNPESAGKVLAFFETNGFITADPNEEATLLKGVQKKIAPSTSPSEARSPFERVIAQDLGDLEPRFPTAASGAPEDLRILLLGGCLAQITQSYLKSQGTRYGLKIDVQVGWTNHFEIIDQVDPKIVVFQPGTDSFLAPLWDHAPFLTSDERRERLETMKVFLRAQIGKLTASLAGRLLLVQGISGPLESPFGRTDFREAVGFDEIVLEINLELKSLIKDNPNALFVDEERLFSSSGKLRILDDHVAPFSHHGPLDYYGEFGAISPVGPDRSQSFGQNVRLEAIQLLAREYLEAYLLWSGKGRIKCLIVDLDNTLWPGVLAESIAELEGNVFYRTFHYGTFGGIHQALKLMKSRGVLLATSSKNDHEDTMRLWGQLAAKAKENRIEHFLTPDDFVLHRINWNRKSENIREICGLLEVDPGAVLFIDDHPVEREEVRFALPTIRTLGTDMNRIRHSLLIDPCLQFNIATQESAQRTEMTKAQLARESARGQHSNERDFLKSLNIQITLDRLQNSTLPRATELIQRSNQFNTTGIRYDMETLRAFMLDPKRSVWCAWVSDKFTDYGLIAVCVLDGNEVANFVQSCRVIGLKASVPILSSILRSAAAQANAGPPVKTWGRIIPTPRNLPCRTLFKDSGLTESTTEPNRFDLLRAEDLPVLDTEVYTLRVGESSG